MKSPKWIILGLSGKRSSGKTTIADMLNERMGYKTFYFAGALKQLCNEYLNVRNAGITEDDKNQIQEHLIINGRHPTYREVLQYVGTDLFRAMYPNVWAQRTILNILEYNNKPRFGVSCVIADTRFPNEVKVLEEVGGLVIRLTRSPLQDEFSAHGSETALDNYPFKYVVDNANMSIEEQFKAVTGIIDIFKEENS